MSASLTLAVAGYAIAVSAVCALASVLDHHRSPFVLPALIVVQAVVIAQAGLDLAGIASGSRPIELATHLGYLASSVLILPLAAAAVRMDERRWGSAALAVACLLVAVVSIRLHQTSAARA